MKKIISMVICLTLLICTVSFSEISASANSDGAYSEIYDYEMFKEYYDYFEKDDTTTP